MKIFIGRGGVGTVGLWKCFETALPPPSPFGPDGPNPTLYYCNAQSYGRAVSRACASPDTTLNLWKWREIGARRSVIVIPKFLLFPLSFLLTTSPLCSCDSTDRASGLRILLLLLGTRIRESKEDKKEATGGVRASTRSANPKIKCDTKCGSGSWPKEFDVYARGICSTRKLKS